MKLKPFFQPVLNGAPCRAFATKRAATRSITRWLRHAGGVASVLQFASPSAQPIVVASLVSLNGRVVLAKP